MTCAHLIPFRSYMLIAFDWKHDFTSENRFIEAFNWVTFPKLLLPVKMCDCLFSPSKTSTGRGPCFWDMSTEWIYFSGLERVFKNFCWQSCVNSPSAFRMFNLTLRRQSRHISVRNKGHMKNVNVTMKRLESRHMHPLSLGKIKRHKQT